MKLIISAMEEEIANLQKKVPFNEKTSHGPYKLYQHKKILLAISQIGTVNASIALTAIIKDYHVTEIYNVGTVGSLKHHLKVFDLVIVESACYLFADATPFGYLYGQIPREPATYLSSQMLLNDINKNWPQVCLGTSDIFIHNKEYLSFVQKKFNNKVDIADMEGTAFFQVAYKFKIPIIAVKVVSDTMMEKTITSAEQFNLNITKISKIIANFTLKYII